MWVPDVVQILELLVEVQIIGWSCNATIRRFLVVHYNLFLLRYCDEGHLQIQVWKMHDMDNASANLLHYSADYCIHIDAEQVVPFPWLPRAGRCSQKSTFTLNDGLGDALSATRADGRMRILQACGCHVWCGKLQCDFAQR